MSFKHAQAILLGSAAALFALLAAGLGAMLLKSAELIDPGAIAGFGKPMQIALAAFAVVFVAAALRLALGGRSQTR